MSTDAKTHRRFWRSLAALVVLAACGGEAPTEVALEPASIRIDRSSITFSAQMGKPNPAPLQVAISNGGEVDLNGLSVEIDFGRGGVVWLTAELDATSAPATLTLEAIPSGQLLVPTTYRADVMIRAAGVSNSPQTVAVTMELAAADPPEEEPVLTLTPSPLRLSAVEGEAAAPAQLEVSYDGTDERSVTQLVFGYADGEPTGWLNAALPSAEIPATIDVYANAGSLSAGEYRGSITVVAGDGLSASVVVILAVDEADSEPDPPVIGVSPEQHSLALLVGDPTPDPVQFEITNLGDGVLYGLQVSVRWEGGATGWAILSMDSSVAPVTLSATFDTEGLPAGDYELFITLSSPFADEDRTVSIRVEVSDPPTEEGFDIDVTVAPAGGGSVALDPAPGPYPNRARVDLRAIPAQGYRFDRRSGDLSGSDPEERIIILRRDYAVTAHFSPVPPKLSGQVTETGVDLEWNYEWPCPEKIGRECQINVEDHYELEESTTSSRDGFRVVFTSKSTHDSPYGRSFDRGPGTYYYRVRAVSRSFASPYSEVVPLTIAEPATPPPAAPSSLSVAVAGGQMTLTWTDNSSDEDGFRVHMSEDPAFGSFNTFETAANEATTILTDQQPPRTFYFRVLAFNAGGESAPSPVQMAQTVAPLGVTRFVNASDYPVYSLVVDGFEQIPSGNYILVGESYEIEMQPGAHESLMFNGVWDGTFWQGLYRWEADYDLAPGQVKEIRFENPTARQLMTRFSNSLFWDGQYVDGGGTIRILNLQFTSGGSWTLWIDGVVSGSGAYTLEARYPGGLNVEIRMIPNGQPQNYTIGTLWETLGFFSVDIEPGRSAELYPR